MFERSRRVVPGLAAALAALLASCTTTSGRDSTIRIQRQGAISVAGSVLGDPATASLSCDHGIADYQIPVDARAVNLMMWHSASAAAWQNRWDGGEGFQSMFLRDGYPVYLWDGPRVGRANWSCEPTQYSPNVGQDQGNFVAWRFGTVFPNWFDGVQFPTDDAAAWDRATRARYQEFDTVANIELQSDAAAAFADRVGPTVALTNSAGGTRALMTATKSDNIVGIVAYENVGYVYPEGEGPGGPQGPFGPIEVPLEDFMRLTEIPLQMVWGDNIELSDRYGPTVEESRRFVELVNRYGGNAEILMLDEAGLVGNTHIPFADMNNRDVADLLSDFLARNGLDARAR